MTAVTTNVTQFAADLANTSSQVLPRPAICLVGLPQVMKALQIFSVASFHNSLPTIGPCTCGDLQYVPDTTVPCSALDSILPANFTTSIKENNTRRRLTDLSVFLYKIQLFSSGSPCLEFACYLAEGLSSLHGPRLHCFSVPVWLPYDGFSILV